MADKMFNKEVTRFSLNTKKECLEEIIAAANEKCEDYINRAVIEKNLEDIKEKLQKLDKKTKSSDDKPRKLSAYNRFVKTHLPEIAKEFPDMKNNERMTKVSELWKKTSPEERQKYTVEEA